MKKENIYVYFSLVAVVIMAIITTMVLFQKDNKVDPLDPEVAITTPTVTPIITEMDPTLPLVSPTSAISPTPTIHNDIIKFTGVFEEPEMSVNGLPEGEYYSFAYYTGQDSTVHYMLNKANNSLSQAEKDILELGKIYPFFTYRVTSTKAQNLPGAAAGNRWSIITENVDVQIQGTYDRIDDSLGSTKHIIYIARGDGAHGGDWVLTISEEYTSQFSALATARNGNVLYLSGKILGDTGAAAGTAYTSFEPDSISK